VYGYHAGPVEGAALRKLVPSDELEALLVSDEWVDLLPYMRRKFWSNDGHGLKVMAVASGFAWRDDDPGGYASIRWYRNALSGIDRDANIARILAYNEDDCAATAALR
jgi:predicted RecB family nuclease